MQEEKKQKPNTLLTPNSVPQAVVVETEQPQLHRNIDNPLDFSPKSGIFWFIKLPSIVFIGMLFSYILGRFGFNILFVLLLCHCVYFIFKRRVKKYALSLDTLSKEKARKESLGEFETVEWLNYIVRKFWEVSEAAVSSQIYSEVNNVLRQNLPPFIKSLKLTELTLGTRPPVVERIGFISTNEDSIIVEFAANFIPLQTSEDILAYFSGEKKHWNTCIELTATVGFVKLPILVRNFTFSGIFKAEISLTRKIPFLKELSFSMLELPLVDFELEPLKTVDFMDIPLLSKMIHKIINSQISNILLSPKSIKVNLENIADYRGKIIGVVYIYVKTLETIEDTTSSINLSHDGVMFGTTSSRHGSDPIFNEGFYEIISDTTKSITVTAQTSNESFIGKIFMRNLNKNRYSEKIHLSNEKRRVFLDATSYFFRITEKKTASAIVNLNLVSIRDLQKIDCPKNRLYSTYCVISIETKETLKVRKVLKRFETKRIFSSKDPFYNENVKFFVRDFNEFIIKISVMDEKDESEIGTVYIPMTDAQDCSSSFYKIGGALNGDVEIKFDMEYIDLDNIDETSINDDLPPVKAIVEETQVEETRVEESLISETQTSIDSEEKSILKNRKIKESGLPGHCFIKKKKVKVKSTEEKPKKTKKPEVPSLNLGIYAKQKHKYRFVDYKKAYRLEIKEIKKEGMFYLVFETDHLILKMDPFTTEININRFILIPIENEEFIKVRLFGMGVNGDIFISEEVMDLNDTVVVFDKTRIEFDVEVKEFSALNAPDRSDIIKLVQFKVDKISKEGIYTLDILTDRGIRSEKIANSVNTVEVGSEDICCILKDRNKPISKFILPIRNCAEEFKLNSNLSCFIDCKVLTCNFSKLSNFSRGILDVHIIKGTNITSKSGSQAIPYIKVYLNSEKVFKTQKKYNSPNPIFNESLKMNVQKNLDTLSFYISDYNSSSSNDVLLFKEFSLFNINEGYSKHDIRLMNGGTNEPSDSYLQVIFNFSKDENSKSVDAFENFD